MLGRRFAVLLTVLFWAFMTGWLWSRHHPASAIREGTERLSRAGKSETRFLVYWGDYLMGNLTVATLRARPYGWFKETSALLTLPLQGSYWRVLRVFLGLIDTRAASPLLDFRIRLLVSPARKIRAFSCSFHGLNQRLEVTGRRLGDHIVLRLRQPLSHFQYELPIEQVRAVSSLTMDLELPALRLGTTVALPTVNPFTGKNETYLGRVVSREHVICGEKIYPAWKLSFVTPAGNILLFLDDQGHLLRQEGPISLIVELDPDK